MGNVVIIYVGISLVSAQIIGADSKPSAEVTLPMADWHTKKNPPRIGQAITIVWDLAKNRWALA